jgi:hypothetical protein
MKPHNILQLNNYLFRYDRLNAFVQNHLNSVIEKIRSNHVQIDNMNDVVNIAISVDGRVLLFFS